MNVAAKVSGGLAVAAGGEEIGVGILLFEIMQCGDAGFRCVEIVEAEFEEGVAVAILGVRGVPKLGGAGET